MNIKDIQRVYFVGIGGIGMSAIARFFLAKGAVVSGYDRTPTVLTNKLEQEGMSIHFTDDVALVDKETQLVVYTPAIPKNHTELNWYRDNGYPVYKRSDVLQWITESLHAVTVAGTHGKTTVSTMIAYLLRETGYGCNAFLGGISVNYQSNYWGSRRDCAVVEADEYDRSFLKLFPDVAVLTAMDADHLDIYGTAEEMEKAFIQYTHNIKPGGTLVVKHGLHRHNELKAANTISYHLENADADVYATNIKEDNGGYWFDIVGNHGTISQVHLPIGGLHNIENAIAALTVVRLMGVDVEAAKKAMAGFKGIKRRFEYIIKTDKTVMIDDYAHHPEELAALIKSAKQLFPDRKCVVAFQPHLFSRTRDFVDGFAHSLDMADEVLLLDIYPARELPMEGVTTKIITDRMKNPAHKIVSKEALVKEVEAMKPSLFIVSGAGDIDKLVPEIKAVLEQ